MLQITNPNRVAAYLRVSTEQQAENNSTNSQVEPIQRYLQLHGIDHTQARWLHEEGLSGAGGTDERPVYAQLVQMVEGGHLDLVVAYDLSRLFRSIRIGSEFVELAMSKGCSIALVREHLLFSKINPTAKLQLDMMLAFAAYERALAIERVRAGMAASKAKKVWRNSWDQPGDSRRAFKLADRQEVAQEARQHIARIGGLPVGFIPQKARKYGVDRKSIYHGLKAEGIDTRCQYQ